MITRSTRFAAKCRISIQGNELFSRCLLSRGHESDSSEATIETKINSNIDKLEHLGVVWNIERLVTSTLEVACENQVEHAIRPYRGNLISSAGHLGYLSLASR